MADSKSWEMASQMGKETFDQLVDAAVKLIVDKLGITTEAAVAAVLDMRPAAWEKALDKAMEAAGTTPVQPDWLIIVNGAFIWIAACEHCGISREERPDHGVEIPNVQATEDGVAPSQDHLNRIQQVLKSELEDAKAELEDTKAELEDAKAELEDATAELEGVRAQLGAEGEEINAPTNKEGSSTQAHLAPPRLVSTTHKPDGTSVFASDEAIQPFEPFGPGMGALYNFDIQQTLPANNTEAVSPSTFANTFPRCAPGGAYFGVVDIPPNHMAPMHRPVSLDYAAVLSGEIVCVLDGGEEKTIGQGEFIIQRGTNHQWINRSQTEVARILCVMVGAEKVVLGDGKGLEEAVPKK